MAVFCSKQVVVPVRDKILSDYAEGEIVKLNENGSPVEFYVAKHDYESDLNGSGRTLLVRKDCYTTSVAWSDYYNTYSSSTIDTWLTRTYRAVLDAAVQTAINNTKFYCAYGNGSSTIQTLEKPVFILSVAEFGFTPFDDSYVDGSVLPIANSLKVAYYNGSSVDQWTRSPYVSYGSDSGANFITKSGTRSAYTGFNGVGTVGTRPCFTLSGNTLFDHSTNLFKG